MNGDRVKALVLLGRRVLDELAVPEEKRAAMLETAARLAVDQTLPVFKGNDEAFEKDLRTFVKLYMTGEGGVLAGRT
jgi:hypothetical protein